MNLPLLKDKEFVLFQRLIYDIAGINMSSAKKALVAGRLAKRVKHFDLPSFTAYFELLKTNDHDELQLAVDLLTTNETYFFREPKHFDFLREKILPAWGSELHRVWSAASSSGEEAYTLAMMLAKHTSTNNWEVVGTDISTRVLQRARTAHYPMERASNIPRSYLASYCLKGTGSKEGMFCMTPELRQHVKFIHANLKTDLSRLGKFDLIFLRNVLIYFDTVTKQQVVSRLLHQLNPGGYLVVGHSESLNGITDKVKVVVPSVYVKAENIKPFKTTRRHKCRLELSL